MGGVKLGLALSLITFATLLNTVGIVVERSISEWHVAQTVGGMLEGCKDLTIAFTSLLLASQVPRFGYRRVLLAGCTVAAGCALMAAVGRAFWTMPVLFVLCGAGFALVKTAVYASVNVIAPNPSAHAAWMNRFEGIYQVGAMAAPLLFAQMISMGSWLNAYWVIAMIGAAAALLWTVTPLPQPDVKASKSSGGMADALGLLKRSDVKIYLGCAWLYVMIEQSIGTWLPTFNAKVFHLAPQMVAALLSVYFGAVAVSRFTFGALVRRFSAFSLQLTFLVCAFALTLVTLLSTRHVPAVEITSWGDVPPLCFLFCLVGFLIGPIYPTLNSMMLSRLEPVLHSSMTGLIIVFSALGGTSGSQIIGVLSNRYDTHTAFHFPLLPITLLALLLIAFQRTEKEAR